VDECRVGLSMRVGEHNMERVAGQGVAARYDEAARYDKAATVGSRAAGGSGDGGVGLGSGVGGVGGW